MSPLKARLLPEHFGGNNSKIRKGCHITELRQTFHRKILLHNIFITKDKCRLLIKVCLKRLLFGLFLCFTPLLLLIFLYRISADEPTTGAIMTCVCTVPYAWFPLDRNGIVKSCDPSMF